MVSTREVLRKCLLFRDFSDNVLDRFSETAEIRLYQAGEIIFAELSEGDEIFLIVDGEVMIELALANMDRNFEIVTLSTAELLGEVSFVEEGRRSATATARTDSRLLVWKCEQWRTICEHDKEVGYRLVLGIARTLCQRLRRWNVRLWDDVSWGME
jgi:CRP-like cAMP-binding protein